MTTPWDDLPIIDVYTRADAINDGTLINATPELLRNAGIRYPLAYTAAAYQDCIAWTKQDDTRKRTSQDQAGREWDVLTAAAQAMRAARDLHADIIGFTVLRVPREGRGSTPRRVTLYVHSGPGDDSAPVLTIITSPDEL
ncbi:DUF6573 family protein [Amycolatopsis sp. NPDC004378]